MEVILVSACFSLAYETHCIHFSSATSMMITAFYHAFLLLLYLSDKFRERDNSIIPVY